MVLTCLLLFFSMKTAKLTGKINWGKMCDLHQQCLKVCFISAHVCIKGFFAGLNIQYSCVHGVHVQHTMHTAILTTDFALTL